MGWIYPRWSAMAEIQNMNNICRSERHFQARLQRHPTDQQRAVFDRDTVTSTGSDIVQGRGIAGQHQDSPSLTAYTSQKLSRTQPANMEHRKLEKSYTAPRLETGYHLKPNTSKVTS
jgi:hypothetical protein